ncbi:hypothetical protein SBBP2_610026 [Burkholderiales bacterium]|nr:hypothetical protein SBBP2_610026 [Burkholderiales bacterium]
MEAGGFALQLSRARPVIMLGKTLASFLKLIWTPLWRLLRILRLRDRTPAGPESLVERRARRQ